ncbi:unnamed protein product, partial [Tetraodon nigroviridis]
METRQPGFLDSEHLKESDEEVNLSSSILTEEEREEILQELGKLEEEIGTLRQVLSSKEKQHADLKQKLGINPLSEFRNNFSRGWRDVQTSVARELSLRPWVCSCVSETDRSNVFVSYKKTSETLSTAGQKTSAAFSTLGSTISRKFEDMRVTLPSEPALTVTSFLATLSGDSYSLKQSVSMPAMRNSPSFRSFEEKV